MFSDWWKVIWSRVSSPVALTFRVIAGLKHVQLVGVVGESEHFDHWVQDNHNPNKNERWVKFRSERINQQSGEKQKPLWC